jgi:hypothetical protein
MSRVPDPNLNFDYKADLLITGKHRQSLENIANITQTYPVHLDFTTKGFVCGGQIRSRVWVEYIDYLAMAT